MSEPLRSWLEAKDKYDGALLLFQIGDRYECYAADAVTVAHACRLELGETPAGTKKCSFPTRELDVHLQLLVDGHRIVICERIEDGDQQ